MRLKYEDAVAYLENLAASEAGELPLDIHFERKTRTLRWSFADLSCQMNLPLVLPLPGADEDENLAEYLSSLPDNPEPYLVVLIRAGSASLGFFIDGDLVAHKVIRKYMVRKSQGRMQISYLAEKGKSRAGSRIRLRESVEFFEEINQKIIDWIDECGEPEMIFYSCPVRLRSHWFSSRVEPPFSLEDGRLISIPHHIHQPDHDELLRVNRLLTSAQLIEGVGD